jgi:UDP-2,3-diacylglucosamine pyrophosphatase LpxH
MLSAGIAEQGRARLLLHDARAVEPHTVSYRAIWLSDVHLGTRGSKAASLLEFLSRAESQNLYLVGDIVEGWRLFNLYWPATHSQVLREIMARAHTGTRVVFIPGNHDEFYRHFAEMAFGSVEIRRQIIHKTKGGQRFLITHGDEFDGPVSSRRWLYLLGDQAYRSGMLLSDGLSRARGALGYSHWSLSSYLKQRVKRAIQQRNSFDSKVRAAALEADAGGIICGHTHIPESRDIDGIQYFNDGDWVENCTALVEHHDGQLELIYYGRDRVKESAAATDIGSIPAWPSIDSATLA